MFSRKSACVAGLLVVAVLTEAQNWPSGAAPTATASLPGLLRAQNEARAQAEAAGERHQGTFVARGCRRKNLPPHAAGRPGSGLVPSNRNGTGDLQRQGYAAPYTVNPAAASHGEEVKSTPVVADGQFALSESAAFFLVSTPRRQATKAQAIRLAPDFAVATSPVVDRYS